MKKLLLIALVLLAFLNPFAQEACSSRISLLTCAPGSELYSTFGHTAVRVTDSTNGADLVYNYGTFEFGPDFYMQFVRGKLLYFLSVESFAEFMYEYRVESRPVQEQVLQLDCAEKQKLIAALNTNTLPQNRYYRYDFLFDNCTTRAKDIIKANTHQAVSFKNILPAKPPTFRDQIHSYLDAGHEYWSKLGIDLLLGAKLDRRVTNEEAMFLPDYLLKGLDSAQTGQQSLVAEKHTVLAMPSPLSRGSIFQPAILFSLLLIGIITLQAFSSKGGNTALRFFDFVLFFLSGIAGILMLFMWFGTDHKVCSNNYNLLWALPTNLVAAFFLVRNPIRIRPYFLIVFWLNCLLLLLWFVLPQELNLSLIPVVLLIVLRSYYYAKPVNIWSRRA